MNIKVLNRHDAMKYKPKHPTIVISITDPDADIAMFEYNDYVDILRLSFHDLDEPIEGLKNCKMFSEEDAEKILKFVSKHYSAIDDVMIHCEAGVSRSAGVAAALATLLNGDDSEFFNGRKYYPNSLVRRTILKVNTKLAGEALKKMLKKGYEDVLE